MLSGLTNQTGAFNFTVRALALGGCQGTQVYALIIAASAMAARNDFDGDGKSDLAVWRSEQSEWRIVRSSDEQVQTVQWGAAYEPYRDVLAAGDYDGDGKTDVAVFRRQNGRWLIKCSAVPTAPIWCARTASAAISPCQRRVTEKRPYCRHSWRRVSGAGRAPPFLFSPPFSRPLRCLPAAIHTSARVA